MAIFERLLLFGVMVVWGEEGWGGGVGGGEVQGCERSARIIPPFDHSKQTKFYTFILFNYFVPHRMCLPIGNPYIT